jgi:hypothetical protein
MSEQSKPALWAVAAAVLLAAGASAYFILKNRTTTGPAVPPGPPVAKDVANFEERSSEAGITFFMNFLPNEQGEKFKINLYDHGAGVAVGDFDGDGRDDIYLVNQLGPNALYRNKGDGTFEDVTAKAGVALGDRICVAATFADYDNDGRQDLFVTSTRGGNVLFRNQGDGTFKDVTKEAGLAHVGHSQVAVFFDYDNDGYLDLFVAQTAEWTVSQFDQASKYYPGKGDSQGLLGSMADSRPESNILYHNNGNGTFTDVTAKAGLGGLGWSADVAVFDYNGDGYLDLLVTRMFGRSQLFRNNGNGTFTDVTLETLGKTPWGGMGAKAFDFNNDGRLDLYIVDMHSDMWTGVLPAAKTDMALLQSGEHKKYPNSIGPRYNLDPKGEQDYVDLMKIKKNEVVFGNTLFQNLGDGRFKEVSEQANMENFWPWGIATGDFDNDGFEDVFIPSGMGYPFVYWPNYLMMNKGDGTFEDRATEAGIEPPARGIYCEEKIGGEKAARASRSAAVADFDGTGRLDIIVNNFNDRPYFLKNHFPQKNYVAFRLQGTRSNRDAIGAVVKLYSGKEVMTRQVSPAGGYLTQSSKTIHFGLGDRTKIDRVEIRWPSGTSQVIEKPGVNKLHLIVEPESKEPKKS